MNEEKKVKYGEIYFYDFGEHEGSIQNGLRPAVVIQDNKLNDHGPTTIIAAITSVTKKLYLPSHILIGEQFGLTKPSMILLEQVACVNQKDLGNFVGAIVRRVSALVVSDGFPVDGGQQVLPIGITVGIGLCDGAVFGGSQEVARGVVGVVVVIRNMTTSRAAAVVVGFLDELIL